MDIPIVVVGGGIIYLEAGSHGSGRAPGGFDESAEL